MLESKILGEIFKIFSNPEEGECCQVSEYCNSLHTIENTSSKQTNKLLEKKVSETFFPYTGFTLALLGTIIC